MHAEPLRPSRERYIRPEIEFFSCAKTSVLANFSAEADFEDFIEGDDL